MMTCSARLPVYGLLIAALSPVGEGDALVQGLLLAGMYLFGRLGELSVHQPVLRRFLALLLDALAFALAAWFVRPNGLATRLKPTAWWKAALFLARIGTVLLGIAFVANLLGHVNLSDLVAVGTMKSVFFAVVMLTGSLALCGLVTASLRTNAAQKSRAIRAHSEVVKRRSVKVIHVAALAMWLW